MPLGNRQSAGTIWLPTGNPDTTNISAADFTGLGGQPGSLGVRFEVGGGSAAYQRVQLDSGAVAGSASGVVAANELAYWKDKSQFLVTNDAVQANAANMQGVAMANSGFRNFVAGIFRSAVTAGRYVDILQRGQKINVKTTSTVNAGDTVVGDTSTTAAQAVAVTAGTAPTCKVIGVCSVAAANNIAQVDVDIPEVQ